MLKVLLFPVLSCLILLSAPLAWANDDLSQTYQRYMTEPTMVGEGRLTFLFWDVYDATLYAPNGDWQPEQPFALTLFYLRALKGEDIAKRSVEEMRGQGFSDEEALSQWFEDMRGVFPDVEEGMRLTGIRTPEGASVFYLDGQRIGQIEDPEFTTQFFNIWLNEKTSEPGLRTQLLGLDEPS